MHTIEEFIKRQSSLPPSTMPRINLISDKSIKPFMVLDGLKNAGRIVQFLTLDTMKLHIISTLPETIEAFLSTGIDVVLSVYSLDILNSSFDSLFDWKYRFEGKKATDNTNKSIFSGNLYIYLCNQEGLSKGNKLQRLIDYEFQPSINSDND